MKHYGKCKERKLSSEKTEIRFLVTLIVLAFAILVGKDGFAENISDITIDWSVFRSQDMNITIPEAPKLELKQVGNVYLVSADIVVDRLLYTDTDQYGSALLFAPYTSDGYIVEKRDITYCFAQIGETIYHYNFPRYIRSRLLEADYVTVLNANSDIYLAEDYPVTSSGWFIENGEYRINTIESGDLCAVVDKLGNPLYSFLYVKPEYWNGTASMDPFKYETPKDLYHYCLSSDDQTASAEEPDQILKKYEAVAPKTLKEAEENWNVVFPYCPLSGPDAEAQSENPETIEAIIEKQLINENYNIIELYLDDDIFATTTQFDHLEGFNNSPNDSYDWQHITNGNDYFFIYQGRYIYAVSVWRNPFLDYRIVKNLLIEETNQMYAEDIEYHFWWIAYDYKSDHLVDKNGWYLQRYRLDEDNGIELVFKSKENEEYSLTFNFQTGALESIDCNRSYYPEWYTYFYP